MIVIIIIIIVIIIFIVNISTIIVIIIIPVVLPRFLQNTVVYTQAFSVSIISQRSSIFT
jgi:hypothetical protein